MRSSERVEMVGGWKRKEKAPPPFCYFEYIHKLVCG